MRHGLNRVRLVCLVCGIGAAGAIAPAIAAPPWKAMPLFKRIEADAEKAYPLSDQHGPWMIMATTFTGDDAETRARELVYELRSRFKLPAYTYNMKFDFGKVEGRGVDRFGRPLRMRPQIASMNEVAVLVGDYPTIDDPLAKKTLERIKFAKPDCLDLEKIAAANKKTGRPLVLWRMNFQDMRPDDDVKKHMGPMDHAFITSNPLLPDSYFAPKGLDKLTVAMNQQLEHSLLKCPGKFTVKVATFTGHVISDQELIKQLEAGLKEPKSELADAEVKAHQLCEALRSKGYEAYEFHDRYSSVVTVGSFDWVGTPRQDGKIEINPQVHAIMETFGANKTLGPGQSLQSVGQPKQIAGIPFDKQPLPVQVPRRAISADYNASALSQR